MGLTFSSIFIIPFALFCFIRNTDLLIKAVIFSIPFSATSILNLGSGVPITAFQFLSLIFIFKQSLNIVYRGHFFWPSNNNQSTLLLLCFLFLGICSFSLIMPALIDGAYYVHSIDIANGYPLIELTFTLSTFKKLFPLFIGILLIFFLLQEKISLTTLRIYLKTYVISICFISSWGLFQYITWISGVDYPGFIFNTMNSDLMVVDSELSVESGVIKRIYSVTQEPSHFVCFLLSGLPLLYVNNFFGQPLISRNLGLFFIIIIVFSLLISFSTTGAGGLAILVFITYLTLYSKNPLSLILRFIFLSIIFTLGIIVLSQFEFFENFLNIVFIEKLISGSMLERLFFIEKAWNHFLDFPILGLGLGNVTSSDLFIFLLSNIGIIGTLSFVFLIVFLLRYAKKSANIVKESNDKLLLTNNLSIINSVLISFYVQLFVYFFMGFVWYLPIFYIMVFFMISLNSITKREN
tara:strand:- start:7247 stop:8641 length:1395 start_codon:yes stop_codon:yes gene_type:complete